MHRISFAFPSSRLIAAGLFALLAAAISLAAAAKQLPGTPAPASPAPQSETAMAQPPAAPAPQGWSSSLAQQAPAAQNLGQNQDQQQNQPQKPVGTAVGPVTQPTGIAGARPSGAAIAPAKQRRVRAFFIRVSIIVAALGATGTVIALSHASPGRPQ